MSEWAAKRFYKTASVEAEDTGYSVRLDGRPIRTLICIGRIKRTKFETARCQSDIALQLGSPAGRHYDFSVDYIQRIGLNGSSVQPKFAAATNNNQVTFQSAVLIYDKSPFAVGGQTTPIDFGTVQRVNADFGHADTGDD